VRQEVIDVTVVIKGNGKAIALHAMEALGGEEV
jgi:hypothetical protein